MYGRCCLAVLADVVQVEAFRQVEVELDRAELPFAAQRVQHLQIDLGTVERAAAGIDLVGDLSAVQRLFQRVLGRLPLFVLAQPTSPVAC